MAQWVRAAGIPVALVGISIERITEPLRDELRGFLAGAELAWFRDRASLDEVGADARAFVAPDLSWLLPFPMLPPPGGRAVALALRKQGGLDLERWRAVVARIDRPVRAWPLYFEHEGDREPLKAVLPDEPVPDEFSLRALDSSSIAVSLRYHGILFAVQAGRPVIAVSSQPKVERFMHEQGLGDWHLGDNDIERLPALIDAIARQEAHAIERVRALRARLSSEAAACGSGVRTRLLNAAAQTAGRRERWSRIRRPLGLVARPTR
jgi:polysaccharide pyruvyl transferase WcaK-like protein